MAAAKVFTSSAYIDTFIHHQADLNSTILRTSGFGRVLRYGFKLAITERLDQTVQRHLILADDVIDNPHWPGAH